MIMKSLRLPHTTAANMLWILLKFPNIVSSTGWTVSNRDSYQKPDDTMEPDVGSFAKRRAKWQKNAEVKCIVHA